jgi:hypothetical protein
MNVEQKLNNVSDYMYCNFFVVKTNNNNNYHYYFFKCWGDLTRYRLAHEMKKSEHEVI